MKLEEIATEMEKEEYVVHLDLAKHLFIQLSRTEEKNQEMLYCYEGEDPLIIPITTGVVGGMDLEKLAADVENPLQFQFDNENQRTKEFSQRIKSTFDFTVNHYAAKRLLVEVEKYWGVDKAKIVEKRVASATNGFSPQLKEIHDKFHYLNGKVDLEKFKSKFKKLGKRYNILSLGMLKRAIRNEQEDSYKKLLAWNTLKECTEAYAESLKKDIVRLKQHDHGDITKTYQALASFYDRIATQATYGAQRTENFIKDYTHTWNLMGLVEVRSDYTEIRDRVVEKATAHFPKKQLK